MIIKKLILKSFGKFQNTTIDLNKGINLVLGENESGKSTIHQFIEGMFYGFYKPNIKNKKISDTYEKYFPWDNATDFSGVMIIEDGRQLRIERNFMKNKDSVRIYDNVTGEDLTETYPYDAVTKTHQPALKHLGLNLAAYQNTVSITQMKSKTTEELVGEIKDNIINLGDTKRVDVSVNNILKVLAEKKAAIGTERSKKSDYGKTKELIDLMESERKDTNKIWEEIKQLKIDENKRVEELHVLEKQKTIIEKKMLLLKKNEDKESYEKVGKLKKEIEELKRKLYEYPYFKDITKEEINDVSLKLNNQDFYKKAFEEEREKLEEITRRKALIENELAQIESVVIEIGASEKISRDVYKYEEFENSKKYTGEVIGPETISNLEGEVAKCKAKKKSLKVSFIISTVIMVLLVLMKILETYGGAIIKSESSLISMLTLAGLLIAFALAFLLWNRFKGINLQLQSLEKNLEQTVESETNFNNRLKDIEERQQQLLSKYECSDIEGLKALRDKKVKEEILYEENFIKARQLEGEKNLMEERIRQGNDKLLQHKGLMEEADRIINDYMNRLNVESQRTLKDCLSLYDDYKGIEQEIQSKTYILEETTKNKPYLLEENQVTGVDAVSEDEISSVTTVGDEQKEHPIADTEEDDHLEKTEEDYEALQNILRQINEKIVIANKDISSLSATITSKENRVKRPAQLEEELKQSYEKLDKMNFKLNTYNIIEDAIRHISRNIQDNFAPMLNERISKIIAIATDYKYSDVKVSSDMEISIIDNELNKMVRADDLSAGTVDLMYFALRLSIAEVVNECETVPIILDDSFVQYDERRLVKMMELLSKLDRQIILFTCHKRESKVIKRIVEDIHVVNL